MPERPRPTSENHLAILTAFHDVIEPIDPASLQGEALGDFTVFVTSLHSFSENDQTDRAKLNYLAMAEYTAYEMVLQQMHHQVHLTAVYPQTTQKLATLYERMLHGHHQRGANETQADYMAAHDIKEMTLTHLERYLPSSLQEITRAERIERITAQIEQAITHPFEPIPIEGSPEAVSDFLEEKLRETMLSRKLPKLSLPQDTPEFQAVVDIKYARMKNMYTIPGYYETAEAISSVFTDQVATFTAEEKDAIDASYLAYLEMQAALLPDEEPPAQI